jgi:DHA1 family putative efflux transporter-like MFS transporter
MKQSQLTLIVFMLMNFVIGMSAMVFGGILDQVAISLNVSVALTGLLATSFSIGAAIGVPIILIVFAQANRKRMMLILLSLSLLSNIATILAPNFILLLVARTLMGITINGYGVMAISTVTSLAEKDRQGRSLAFLIMGNALAMLVGIPLARALSGILDWRGIFWILNTLTLLAFIYFALVLPNPKEEAAKMSILDQFEYLKSIKVWTLLLFTLVMFSGYAALNTFVTPFLLDRFPSLNPIMSLVLVGLGLASFIGNNIGGHLSDRIGYSKSMLVGAILQALNILMVIVLRNFTLFNILFIIFWIMSAWITGLQLNLGIMQETHHDARFIISLTGTSIQMGSAIGSSVAALIVANYGIQSIVYFTLGMTVLMVVIQSFAQRIR